MARKPNKVILPPVYARTIRGPRKTDGRWYWRAEVHEDGTRTVWTGWGTREEVARTVAVLVASGAHAATPEPDRREVRTVRDLMETWLGAEAERPNLKAKTLTVYRFFAKNIVKAIGDVALASLDLATMNRLRDARLTAKAAETAVNQEITILRRAWRWGAGMGLCADRTLPRPVLRVHLKRDKTTPTPDEVGRVIAHMQGWPRLAVIFLASTGARLDELASLRWKDIDLRRGEHGEIRFDGKTGPRPFPVPEALARELAMVAHRPPEGRVLAVGRDTARTALSQRYIPAACEAAGVRRFTPHGLRRMVVGILYRRTDPGTAGALLGHAAITAMRYYHQATPEGCAEAVKAARLGVFTSGRVLAFTGRDGGE